MTEKTITLTLSINDVNVILAGLLELPAKASLDVIGRIKQQADAQLRTEDKDEDNG